MPADLQRPRELFLHAVGKLPPEEWDGYVAGACGGDAELEQQVGHLLRVHREAGSFLDRPAAGLGITGAFTPEAGAEASTARSRERPGMAIGPYKLLQQIGEGGMGTVFMAEQTHPVQRKVALKVIKAGMDSRQVIARFEAERQALAMMDHVNIARVLDAGATESGRPFFVMELIHGVPITTYCDDCRLTPRERLELFVPVCQAIQHAHQKGIIHRDIKPSNVMVTLYDGKPVPKVIDFGVAKATEQTLTERTLFTQYGAMVGTLEYMSPEQAEFSALGVDTRSDIYSLGVLLYELLTGSTPLTHQRMKEAAFGEILRMIKEDEPPRPSTRLSDSGEALVSISANRHTEPARLTRLVRGELDWIVMKTLEKDRNHRYETASGFAADVRRYLDDEPVQACPPSAAYRVRKFVRRNKRPVAAGAALVAALVLGMVGTSIGLARALRAEGLTRGQWAQAVAEKRRANAERANAVASEADTKAFSNFLVEDVLAVARPRGERGGLGIEVSVKAALDAAAAKIEERFRGRPRAEAIARHDLGVTFRMIGELEKGEEQLRRAHELRTRVLGADHHDTLNSGNSLAVLYQIRGRLGEAEPLFARALAGFRRIVGEEHVETLTVMKNVAKLYSDQRRFDEAEPLLVRTLEVRRRVLGEGHRDTLDSTIALAMLHYTRSRTDEAERLLVRALEVAERGLGRENPVTLSCMINLTTVLLALGRLDEAEPLGVEAHAACRRILGEEHIDTLNSMHNLASLYQARGRLDEARALSLKALESRRRVLGGGHPFTLNSTNNLAMLDLALGRLDEAEPLLVEALEVARRVLGEAHPITVTTMSNLAILRHAQGRTDEAEPLLVEASGIFRRTLGEDHPDTLKSINNLAMLYKVRGRPGEAEPLCREVLEKTRRRHGEDSPLIADSLDALGLVLINQGRYADAEPLFRQELAIREKHRPEDWATFYAKSSLGFSLLGEKKSAEAEPLLLAGYDGLKRHETEIPAMHRLRLAGAVERIVHLYEAQGRPEKAAEWRAKLATAK